MDSLGFTRSIEVVINSALFEPCTLDAASVTFVTIAIGFITGS